MFANGQKIRTIIITSPDQTDQDWIWRMMASNEVEILGRVGLRDSALELAEQQQPDLVIIDQKMIDAARTIELIHGVAPDSICIAIVPNSELEHMRDLLAIGARDVLPTNVPYADLHKSLLDIMTVEAERKRAEPLILAPRDPSRGKLVVMLGPKGGVGTTTAAANLAIAIHKISKRKTVLADFSLQFGSVDTHLNLRSKYSLVDLAGLLPDIDEGATGLQNILNRHSSGIDALLAPDDPQAVENFSGADAVKILDFLQRNYSYVVVDTWSSLDEVTVTILDRADEILLILTPELPLLRNAKHFLAFALRRQIPLERIRLVLNRFPSVEGITVEEIEQNLGTLVYATIPSDGELMIRSVNLGVPVMISHPDSQQARNILKLGAIVSGAPIAMDALSKAKSGRRLGTGPLKIGTGPLRRLIGMED